VFDARGTLGEDSFAMPDMRLPQQPASQRRGGKTIGEHDPPLALPRQGRFGDKLPPRGLCESLSLLVLRHMRGEDLAGLFPLRQLGLSQAA
jgi:hypothetical protein